MKDKITATAVDLFLRLGFKSVTMDDIANNLCISKKTLYKYFKNKHALVEESAGALHASYFKIIDTITAQEFNPIKENFEIKKVLKKMFQNASSSPIYQLKKYYPKIHEKTMQKEKVLFSGCIQKSIERGIEQGYYRADVTINLATQFNFYLASSIHENTIENNKIPKLEQEVLAYHTRAIATKKGILELENQLKNNQL